MKSPVVRRWFFLLLSCYGFARKIWANEWNRRRSTHSAIIHTHTTIEASKNSSDRIREDGIDVVPMCMYWWNVQTVSVMRSRISAKRAITEQLSKRMFSFYYSDRLKLISMIHVRWVPFVSFDKITLGSSHKTQIKGDWRPSLTTSRYILVCKAICRGYPATASNFSQVVVCPIAAIIPNVTTTLDNQLIHCITISYCSFNDASTNAI